MLSPGTAATSADPSRLARKATPAVTPLRTTCATERSRGTAPAGDGGANCGASMRGGRGSSIGNTSGLDRGMFRSAGSSGAMIGPRDCRWFNQEPFDGELSDRGLPAMQLPDGGGVMTCGSRVARLARGGGGSTSVLPEWDPN